MEGGEGWEVSFACPYREGRLQVIWHCLGSSHKELVVLDPPACPPLGQRPGLPLACRSEPRRDQSALVAACVGWPWAVTVCLILNEGAAGSGSGAKRGSIPRKGELYMKVCGRGVCSRFYGHQPGKSRAGQDSFEIICRKGNEGGKSCQLSTCEPDTDLSAHSTG